MAPRSFFPAMLAPEVIGQLRQRVGSANVLTAQEDLIPYSFDGTAALRQMPGCVVLVSKTQEVSEVLRFANAAKIPVVTRGSGTGLSGGSVPSPECIVLCTVKMGRILELDRANLTLLSEPGVTTLQIADAAAAAGLFYPPDPGSMKISTIGGNVAENSGGLRGLKYGITRNYVMGLEVVLPDGRDYLDRQQVRQGRRRLFAQGHFHRLGRHAGSHHQGSAQTDSQTGRQENNGGDLRANGPRGRGGFGHHRRADHSLHPRNSWTAPPSIAWRITPRSACRWIARRCC